MTETWTPQDCPFGCGTEIDGDENHSPEICGGGDDDDNDQEVERAV